MLNGFNSTISAHWNEFVQNRWIFAILPNSGGSKYFPHKCGDFFRINSCDIELKVVDEKSILKQVYIGFSTTINWILFFLKGLSA
jgi:hypothetical protein